MFGQLNDLPNLSFFEQEIDSSSYVMITNNNLLEEETKYIRTDFFDNNQIIRIVEVERFNARDTLLEQNLSGGSLIKINSEIRDIYDGSYKEFWIKSLKDSIIKSIKIKGQFINNIPTGEFEFYDTYGDKSIVNFNKDGKIFGEYFEFYYVPETDEYKLKMEGQFECTNVQAYEFDFDIYKKKLKTKKSTRRIGKWIYYDLEGNEIGSTLYSWK